jgi:hypothetical protein
MLKIPFWKRAALTSRSLISLISFLDEKFRTPLVLEVGGTAWTKNALGGIAEAIHVASNLTFRARGFSCGFAAVFQSCLMSLKKPLREPAGMCTLKFGGSALGNWSVKDAGDYVETFVLRMVLAGPVKHLWVVPL